LKKVLECVFINSAQMAIAIETARIKHYSYLQHHHLVAWYWAEQYRILAENSPDFEPFDISPGESLIDIIPQENQIRKWLLNNVLLSPKKVNMNPEEFSRILVQDNMRALKAPPSLPTTRTCIAEELEIPKSFRRNYTLPQNAKVNFPAWILRIGNLSHSYISDDLMPNIFHRKFLTPFLQKEKAETHCIK